MESQSMGQKTSKAEVLDDPNDMLCIQREVKHGSLKEKEHRIVFQSI